MNRNDYKILLVDDEKDILEFIGYNLSNEGFQIYTASNGEEALKIAREKLPQLVLLDVMMPGMDGIETCEEIRKIQELENTMIAFLTARGEDYSQIAGFEAGGDDYITKPIKPKLLISKIKSLLKRSNINSNFNKEQSGHQLVSGDLIIDKERYIVIKKDKEIFFPRKEFELLSLLISKPDKVFSRDEIFDRIWGDNIVVGDRTIDVHIRKLREKLGDQYIKTIKGIGYKYVQPD
ncbi:MAG: response regulator transcription factor [Bacteroidales bacterium]|nr:response regulator transcription factor [Bacteroidales bacterium]